MSRGRGYFILSRGFPPRHNANASATMITVSAAGASVLPPMRFGCPWDDATAGARGAIEEEWAPASNSSLRTIRKMMATATTTHSFCHFGMGDFEGSSGKVIVHHDNMLAEHDGEKRFSTRRALEEPEKESEAVS